ncbi:MAG: DUF1353 domain-containing protein [Nitrospinae bacterium]|nr:DUF1353 domain-containing protein [Nitrospinota bacterium]
MSRFMTPLRVQLLDEIDHVNAAGGDGIRASWRLLSPLKYDSDYLKKVIEVPAGFDTDFSSTPKGMQQYAFKASVLHDWAYRTKSLSKEDADEMFLEAMLVDRIPVAHTYYLAVKNFGQMAYDPDFKGW